MTPTGPAATSSGPDATPTGPGRAGAAAWAGVALFTVCAMFSALLECFLVPLYAGSVLVPVAVLLAVVGNIAIPLLSRSLVGRSVAGVLPFLGWLAVVFVLVGVARPEGDVIVPGGSGVEWVGYGVMLGGALAATVTLVVSAGPPGGARPAVAR